MATATKKASAKKTEPIVVDLTDVVFDETIFDTWDDAQEEAAIAVAAAAAAVQHVIVEGRLFAGRFPDGTVVKAPLTFSVSDLEAITADHDNPVDQIKALFVRLGDEESASVLEGQNLASVVIYAEKFFATFAKIAEVALGKSSTS